MEEVGSIIHLDVIVTTMDVIALARSSSFAIQPAPAIGQRQYNGFADATLTLRFLKEQGQEEAI